jgi:hypothetical protein
LLYAIACPFQAAGLPQENLFNFALKRGFDAIEIQLKNERKYRVGTNHPKELLAAVLSAMASSS